MNNTGQQGEKTGYRIVLLLVVALAAFSSAMKELNKLQQFTLEAGRFAAEWSEKIAPAEPIQTTVRLETCESSNPLQQSLPSVDLDWLDQVTEPSAVAAVQFEPRKTVISRIVEIRRDKPAKIQIANLKKLRDLNPDHFEVRILTGSDNDSDEVVIPELPSSFLKAKTRKHDAVRINARDREMLLKTLNRFSFRIAS